MYILITIYVVANQCYKHCYHYISCLRETKLICLTGSGVPAPSPRTSGLTTPIETPKKMRKIRIQED